MIRPKFRQPAITQRVHAEMSEAPATSNATQSLHRHNPRVVEPLIAPIMYASSRLFGAVVFICNIPFALADAGDDFSNNLFSDMAPILALFGEQVAKQYMSQSMGWVEDIIFAAAPLGIITAITGAIRVGGPAQLKALIGRAREGTGVVEVELMSSTSADVCELWNGSGVVRVLGSSPMMELFYLQLPADVHDEDSGDGQALLTGWNSHPTTIFDGKSAKKKGILRRPAPARPSWWSGAVWARRSGGAARAGRSGGTSEAGRASETGYPEEAAPNIALNLSGDRVTGFELAVVSVIGISLQLGVIVFAGLSVLSSPWNENLKKDQTPPQTYAFPSMASGTVALSLGMFLCAHIIERSTNEETWTITEPGNNSRVKVAWLQKDGIVNDQQFRSYFIERDSETNSADTWEKFLQKFPKISTWLSADRQQRILTSRKADRLQLATLTVASTLISVAGFIAQFVGLRGLNWTVTIAQLVATAIMTVLRAVVRRNLVHEVDPIELDRGYELDWAARHVKRCKYWSVITWKPGHEDIPAERGTGNDPTDIPRQRLATEVLDARCRLGALSGWEFQWQKTAIATSEAIETIINFLCAAPDVTLTRTLAEAQEFEWGFLVEVASAEPNTASNQTEVVKLHLTRKWLPELPGWGDWKVDQSQIEAVLGLWMLQLKDFANQPLPRARRVFAKTEGPLDRKIYERWIRRQTQGITIDPYDHEKTLLLIGEPSTIHASSRSNRDLLVVISEAPMESICGQLILSEFIYAFAEKALEKPLGGQVRVRAGSQGVKDSFGLRNTILDDLAAAVEKTGLSTIEEALLSIVPPLAQAEKLPTIRDTTEVFSDTANEIKAYLGGGRLGPLRLAFLTQIYDLPTGRLSGFINRYGVTPLEPEQHVYPIFFATGTPIFDVLRRRCHAS